ncbi:unnamed protein product [Sphenostylis stenocarpa]|uniref:Uncharacterized protein n=1 Tax=Sphenostylis stenocarpa TaxID=92480 RepID=A0AA86VAR3_9FABA|nr:unnamed protein product [Sphenostylis stenocarpa]
MASLKANKPVENCSSSARQVKNKTYAKPSSGTSKVVASKPAPKKLQARLRQRQRREKLKRENEVRNEARN